MTNEMEWDVGFLFALVAKYMARCVVENGREFVDGDLSVHDAEQSSGVPYGLAAQRTCVVRAKVVFVTGFVHAMAAGKVNTRNGDPKRWLMTDWAYCVLLVFQAFVVVLELL